MLIIVLSVILCLILCLAVCSVTGPAVGFFLSPVLGVIASSVQDFIGTISGRFIQIWMLAVAVSGICVTLGVIQVPIELPVEIFGFVLIKISVWIPFSTFISCPVPCPIVSFIRHVIVGVVA